MIRAVVILAIVVSLGLVLFVPGVRCILRGHHRPERRGATYACRDCSATGHDLEAMGEDVALATTRRTYERRHGTLTRTSSWEPESPRPSRDPGFYRPDNRRRADRVLPRRAV